MNRVTVSAQVLEDAKHELIEKLKSNIDLDQVKSICREQYGLEAIEGLDIRNGDIVSHNDQVAFRLDFEIRTMMSVFIDKEGNCTSTSLRRITEPTTPEERIEEAGGQAATGYSQF